jgi:hypothetical protein
MNEFDKTWLFQRNPKDLEQLLRHLVKINKKGIEKVEEIG